MNAQFNDEAEYGYFYFFNLGVDLFCISDYSGTLRKLNFEWERALGYKLEELEGVNFLDFVHNEDRITTISSLTDLRQGKSVIEFDNRFRCKDGSYKWLEWRSQSVGELVYSAARDVTLRKRQERELENALNFSSRVLQSSPIGISTYDSTGQCKSCNRAYADIVGAPSIDMMISHNFHQIRSWKRSELYDLALHTLRNQLEVHKEIHYLSSFGKEMWLDCFLTGFKMNDESHLLMVINDITEKKEIEIAMQSYADELRELNAAKDKFFSIISHDLRGPFQGLLGYSKILHTEYDNLSDDDRKEIINSIDGLSINTYKLLENLLNWTRLQTGKMTYNPEVLNVKMVCAGAIELLRLVAENKGIELINDVAVKHLVKADLNMVQTVTRNLISNAIKFTNEGGKITLSSTEQESFILISVEDTGVGMRKEEKEMLFRMDAQHTSVGTAGEKGTGLGLLLCKEMIERCGGTIVVESKLGVGSTFIFSLPKA
ncbi:MAG: PAS domain-containing sensor histidine kinase [Ignavibacteria bacterium]|nr:PAS domain-containing sensor histidine kinase [Ignavibacteria bacterium]